MLNEKNCIWNAEENNQNNDAVDESKGSDARGLILVRSQALARNRCGQMQVCVVVGHCSQLSQQALINSSWYTVTSMVKIDYSLEELQDFVSFILQRREQL